MLLGASRAPSLERDVLVLGTTAAVTQEWAQLLGYGHSSWVVRRDKNTHSPPSSIPPGHRSGDAGLGPLLRPEGATGTPGSLPCRPLGTPASEAPPGLGDSAGVPCARHIQPGGEGQSGTVAQAPCGCQREGAHCTGRTEPRPPGTRSPPRTGAAGTNLPLDSAPAARPPGLPARPPRPRRRRSSPSARLPPHRPRYRARTRTGHRRRIPPPAPAERSRRNFSGGSRGPVPGAGAGSERRLPRGSPLLRARSPPPPSPRAPPEQPLGGGRLQPPAPRAPRTHMKAW